MGTDRKKMATRRLEVRRDWTGEGGGGPGLYIPVSHAGDNTVMMNHLDQDQAPASSPANISVSSQ